MPTISYLDETGVRALANQLAAGMNEKIYDSIIDTLTNATNRDANHTLSAAALYALLGATNASDSSTLNGKLNNLSTNVNTLQQVVNGYTHLQIEIVTGEITSIISPSTSKLYLQRDDVTDSTFVMYIYRENVEIPVLDENDEPTYENGELVTQTVNQWVAIGKTDIILQNYWSKDEVEDLKTALSFYNISLISNPTTTIGNKVTTAFAD